MIIAREFTKSDEGQVTNLVNEIRAYDGNFEGMDNIGRIEDFDEFLQMLEKNKQQELIKPGYSPQTTFGVFEDGKLIGGFNLRHELKDALDKKQITKIEFENAYKEAYQLMERLQNKKQELQNFTDKYLNIMLEDYMI